MSRAADKCQKVLDVATSQTYGGAPLGKPENLAVAGIGYAILALAQSVSEVAQAIRLAGRP